MRTTIELPDELFREAKALAALRGSSLKDLVNKALARELGRHIPAPSKPGPPTNKLPVIPWKGKKKLDLSKFNFDDLLS